MAFQLVIAEGKEAGREFVFEQTSVLIGRTSDCDVVLYDPGVSRKHARIFSEASAYFVEDMGSSNGTKVNGAIIKKKQLSDGDAISLGPVVFNFAGLQIAEENTDAAGQAPGQSTRIVSASDVARRKGKGAALAPEGAGEEELLALARSNTRTIQAVKEARDLRRNSQPGSNQKAVRSNGANGAAPSQPPARRSNPERAVAAERPHLSAAERARIKRQSGPGAGFQIWWAEASKGTRTAVTIIGCALGAGALYGGYVLAFPPPVVKERPPETNTLQPNVPVEQSFGLGDDVTYERVDQKFFDFEYKSPVKTVAIIHFQAKEISASEVEISVNGTPIGFVPPDTLAVLERSNEALVPASSLVRNGTNKIIFDNVRNPPNKDTWRIWNVWVEVFPLPDLGRDELVKSAQEHMRRAQDFWDRRMVGAENNYRAWRAFRDAWLVLEAIEGQKPMEYNFARDKMREAQKALDQLCSKLLLEAQSAYNQKQWDACRSTLEHVNEYFPKKDQPCPLRAEDMRSFYEL